MDSAILEGFRIVDSNGLTIPTKFVLFFFKNKY